MTRTFIGTPCPQGHTQRYRANSKCVQCSRALKRAQFAADPDAQARRSKAWRARNKERESSRYKKWSEENPLKIRMRVANQKAVHVAAPGKWTDQDVEDRRKLQRGRCAYFRHCRTMLGDNFHCDHIEPLKRGGTNHPSNLQLTCPTCNLTKSAKPPAVFAREIGWLI